jgi:hypothetical protein
LPFLSILALAAVSCNSSPSGTIQIVTGEETDTFSRSPAPTKLRIDAVDSGNNVTTLATATLPTDSVDLGTQDQTAVATLEVFGLDDSGNQLVFGASVPIEYGALDGVTLPVFVQRSGELARMPSPPADTRQSPTLTVISGRFLFIGGGTDPNTSSSTDLYDFAQFAPLGSPPTLPRVPLSMPLVGTVGLLIDGQGATYYDFSASAGKDAPAPSGFTFADVAGGTTVYSSDGTAYVVGATRTTGAPTAAVLKIDPSDTSNANYPTGNLSWLTLTAPRLGAGATWVDGRGLVVGGGSATAAGAEVVGAGQTTGSALAYPPDASAGAGMTALDPQHVLLAGGMTPAAADAGVRAIDLGCAASCTTTPWAALPTPVTSVAAFSINGARAFVVGNEPASGKTHAFLVTSAAATEVPTKVPHTNAGAVLSPVGSVVLFGGANEIESFTPSP